MLTPQKWRSRLQVLWCKRGAKRANPVLLEPIMAIEVRLPEEYMGDVIVDLNSRRGSIQSMDDASGIKVIRAQEYRCLKCLVILATCVQRLKVVLYPPCNLIHTLRFHVTFPKKLLLLNHVANNFNRL